MSQKLFPRDPLFFPPTIKIFIGTKAEGTELLRWQIKVQIGKWGRARCGVEGHFKCHKRGPCGLGWRDALHLTLAVKIPHSPLPSHIHPGGSWGPAVTPWGGTTPSIHPWLSVSQSVSPSLTFRINKPLRPQLLPSGAKNSSRTPALAQG